MVAIIRQRPSMAYAVAIAAQTTKSGRGRRSGIRRNTTIAIDEFPSNNRRPPLLHVVHPICCVALAAGTTAASASSIPRRIIRRSWKIRNMHSATTQQDAAPLLVPTKMQPQTDARFRTRSMPSSMSPTRTASSSSSLPQPEPPPFYVAHMNFARLKAPMEDPSMSEFRLAMGPINALAQATPGFVWSLNEEAEDNGSYDETATTKSQREDVPLLKADPLLMPQLSLWENVEAIQHFAFKSGHAMYWKRRREWFTACQVYAPYCAVCWWRSSSSSEHPTLWEAFDRLEHLHIHGPSAHAFDFKSAKEYPMPS